MDLKNKKVLVRVDYNVPLKDGKVDNTKRIVATEKTIKHLLDNNCRVVLIAHLGRPKGKVCPEFSLAPVAAEVEKLLLTHFWPEIDKEKYVEEAKEIFPNTEAAIEGKKLILRRK